MNYSNYSLIHELVNLSPETICIMLLSLDNIRNTTFHTHYTNFLVVSIIFTKHFRKIKTYKMMFDQLMMRIIYVKSLIINKDTLLMCFV